MKKPVFYLLPFLLWAVGMLASCEEVEEASEYDNWRARNEAFIDSISTHVGNNYIGSLEDVQRVEEGEMFAIRDLWTSTNENSYYIYCKKIKKLDDYANARRPLFTESVNVYYYGTLMNGLSFDGNFVGYGATDQGFLDKNDVTKAPTDFDSPAEFSLSGGTISAWMMVLSYMHVGERWMVYIPWQCAYGSSGQGSIPGYSALAFDMQLENIVDED